MEAADAELDEDGGNVSRRIAGPNEQHLLADVSDGALPAVAVDLRSGEARNAGGSWVREVARRHGDKVEALGTTRLARQDLKPKFNLDATS